MNECHNCMQAMADTMKNNATNGYDFAIASAICLTLLVITVVALCKWFAWKETVRKEAADAAERQQAAEKACSEQKARNELLNKLLKALADGPQNLERGDYNSGELYFETRNKEHKAYVKQLRELLNLNEQTGNENKA